MKHTLLIIDDDNLILNTLRENFSRMPGEIFTAQTVSQAKDLLGRIKPEVVLTDLLLPKATGAGEIMDFMKADPALAQVPVLIFTNLDTPELRQTMAEKGAKEYMIKGSFSLDDLFNRVMQYLEPVQR